MIPSGVAPVALWYDVHQRSGLLGVGICREKVIHAPTTLLQIEEAVAQCAQDAPPLHAGWIGGFRFDVSQHASERWQPFAAARWMLPLLFIELAGDKAFLGAHLDGPETAREAIRLLQQWQQLTPHSSTTIALDAQDPGEEQRYLRSVEQALSKIAGGDVEKVVLARTASASIPPSWTPRETLGRMSQDGDPGILFAICPTPTNDVGFFGHTPETLYRRRGMHIETDALAGTIRTDPDLATNIRLGQSLLESRKDRREHQTVVSHLQSFLEAAGADVVEFGAPRIRKMGRVQHLHTPVHATLSRARPHLQGLHPTPAVCGHPEKSSRSHILGAEGFDRGWYAGGIGLIQDDAESFAVALRCANFDHRSHSLEAYAGAGIVAGSQPSSELEETKDKLAAIASALAGSTQAHL